MKKITEMCGNAILISGPKWRSGDLLLPRQTATATADEEEAAARCFPGC
jgi:hypothetical protein